MKYLKKGLSLFIMCAVVMMMLPTVSLAATVENQSTTQESGWNRIDDSSDKIICTGGFTTRLSDTSGNSYGNTIRQSKTVGDKIMFKFYGSKFRLIGIKFNNRSSNIQVSIDGVVNGTFSQYSTTLACGIVDYEVPELQLGYHTVTITLNSSPWYCFDAIEIDESGYLVDPYAPTNLKAIEGNSKVDLFWDTLDGATYYNIKRSTSSGGPYTTIGTSTTNSYTDITAKNGTTYYYVVSANVNGKEGPIVGPVSATPKGDSDYTGNKAILEITMTNGNIKEYDLTIDELDKFLTWYDNRSCGTGKSYFKLIKRNNVKPFLSRKEYLSFDKIYSFEVKDYNE